MKRTNNTKNRVYHERANMLIKAFQEVADWRDTDIEVSRAETRKMPEREEPIKFEIEVRTKEMTPDHAYFLACALQKTANLIEKLNQADLIEIWDYEHRDYAEKEAYVEALMELCGYVQHFDADKIIDWLTEEKEG